MWTGGEPNTGLLFRVQLGQTHRSRLHHRTQGDTRREGLLQYVQVPLRNVHSGTPLLTRQLLTEARRLLVENLVDSRSTHTRIISESSERNEMLHNRSPSSACQLCCFSSVLGAKWAYPQLDTHGVQVPPSFTGFLPLVD